MVALGDAAAGGSAGCALKYEVLPDCVRIARVGDLFGVEDVGSAIVDQPSGGGFEPTAGRTFSLVSK